MEQFQGTPEGINSNACENEHGQYENRQGGNKENQNGECRAVATWLMERTSCIMKLDSHIILLQFPAHAIKSGSNVLKQAIALYVQAITEAVCIDLPILGPACKI